MKTYKSFKKISAREVFIRQKTRRIRADKIKNKEKTF